NRYRYMLEGLDDTWQEVGSDERLATYTTLPPREYTFRVQGATSRGPWSEPGARLRINILPAWWNSWWFRAACLVFFIVLIWTIHRLRVHSVEQRYVERTRAAEAIASQAVELKQTEKRLRKSEAYLAEAQKLSHTGSFGWDVSSGEVYWSAETFWIFEYEPTTQTTIEHVLQRVHPEDKAAVEHLIERMSIEEAAFEFEHRLLMPDGSVKHLQVMARPSRTESGGLEFVGAITDITQRRRGEEKLLRSEAYLAEAQSVTHTGSCAIDGASRQILYWSDEMFRLFGFDPQQGLPQWEQW